MVRQFSLFAFGIILSTSAFASDPLVAFRCYFAQPLNSPISLRDVIDKNEIKEIRWASKKEVLTPSFWRYQNNYDAMAALFAK